MLSFSEEAMTIHQLCLFGLAMFDESEWCNMLDKEDLFIFEYLYDLKVNLLLVYMYIKSLKMMCLGKFTV
jgi:hypothetical protein